MDSLGANKGYTHEITFTIEEAECYLEEENIFEGNIFTTIENIRSYSAKQIIGGLLAVFCKFYKVVLAIFMMCKTIIQEKQDNLNSQELLEKMYHKNLEEVWDSLKGIASTLHPEDYKEEMEEAKRFANDRSLLQENFHQWTPQHFQRHAIGVQLYAQQLNSVSPNANKLRLFPPDFDKMCTYKITFPHFQSFSKNNL